MIIICVAEHKFIGKKVFQEMIHAEIIIMLQK